MTSSSSSTAPLIRQANMARVARSLEKVLKASLLLKLPSGLGWDKPIW